MAKKEKSAKGGQEKLQKKAGELEKELNKTRAKYNKVMSKLARMDEVQDYVLKDKYGTDVKLSDMFGDKKELIVVHNMGRSCSYCTLWADGFSGVTYFIEKKASFVLTSPDAPEIMKDFTEGRGWKFRSYSTAGNPFTADMGYYNEKDGYWPGASVFVKSDDGKISRVSKTVFGPGDFYCSPFSFFDLLPSQAGVEQ